MAPNQQQRARSRPPDEPERALRLLLQLAASLESRPAHIQSVITSMLDAHGLPLTRSMDLAGRLRVACDAPNNGVARQLLDLAAFERRPGFYAMYITDLTAKLTAAGLPPETIAATTARLTALGRDLLAEAGMDVVLPPEQLPLFADHGGGD
jgi:hypothetical protein